MSKLLEQINTGRKTFRLGDLVKVNERSIASNFPYSEIEYIDTASVVGNHFNKPEVLNIKKAPSRAKRLVKDGDTIISTVRPNLKHYGFIRNPNENTVVSTGFAVVTPKKIDPRYLYSYLTRDSITSTLNAIAEAATTTFPAFKPEVLSEMEVRVPDLSTQKRIGEILDAYDTKMENNNNVVKNLEAMADAIFDEWFIKFRFPGHEQVEFFESEAGKIPKGWEMRGVLDIIERISVGKKYDNKSALPSGKVPILDQGQSGCIGYHNNEPDVIATLDNPVIVFTNHTCYYRLLTEPFSCIQNVLPYIGRDGYSTFFVYFLTKGKIKIQEYKGHWPEFEQQMFVVPPVAIAEKFTSIAKNIIRAMVTYEKENAVLRESRGQQLNRFI